MQDTRKPEPEIRVTEILGVIGNIQRNIDNLDEWTQPVEVVPSQNKNDKARIVHEARGVCLILGPWNFPLGLSMGPLAAAIAAGNCCMVKLTDLLPAATAGIAAKITNRRSRKETSPCLKAGSMWLTALLALPFSHIFFTGSTRVGKLVYGGGREEPGHVTLELGGKSPVIVDEGADVTNVAADLAAAKQYQWRAGLQSVPTMSLSRYMQQGALIEAFQAKVKQNLYPGRRQYQEGKHCPDRHRTEFSRASSITLR